jgi:subtilisin
MANRISFFGRFAGLLVVFALIGQGDWVSAQSGPAGGNRPQMVDVLIEFINTPGAQDRAAVQRAGGQVRHSYTLVPAIAARLPEPSIAALRKNPRVTLIEPDMPISLIDPVDIVVAGVTEDAQGDGSMEVDPRNIWNVSRIGADWVHEMGYRGAGIGVAVLDTGVCYTHSLLSKRYAGGFNFINNTADPWDDNGHGTHVAGTILADSYVFTSSGDGLQRRMIGIAPNDVPRLYAMKTLGATGGGNFGDVIAALNWCVEHNEKLLESEWDTRILVANHSYGSSGDPGVIVRNAFDASFAKGILHVAAAGNAGRVNGRGDNVGYPAKYDSVIAVAATNENDQRASFSSTGPALEISAPGVNIWSTYVNSDINLARMNGTSMASPHVAGVAALMFNANTNLTPVDVRMNLIASSRPLGDPNHFGYGLVDALSAVQTVLPPSNDGGSEDDGDPEDVNGPEEDEPGNINELFASVSVVDVGPRGRHMEVTATVTSADNTVVAGALVVVELTHVLSGNISILHGTSGLDGKVRWSFSNANASDYRATVLSVEHPN